MKISCQFKQPEKFRRYKQLPKDLQRELKTAINDVTRQTSKDAKMFARSNVNVITSGLVMGIGTPYITDGGFTGEVSVRVPYAPYVEFGTGNLVKVPQELRDYAMQFKGRGIRQVNLPARPYLSPAFFINRDRFTKECNRILKKVI